MTEDEYRAIAASCDRLLSRPDAPLAWIATPWLHVICPHPVIVERYRDLVTAWRAGRMPHGVGPLERARDAASTARALVRSVRSRAISPARIADALAADGGEVLSISWLVDPAHLRTERDFYFGDIRQRLADRGVRSLHLLRNHTDAPTEGLMRAGRRPGRALLPDVLPPREELALLARALRARRAMRRAAATAAEPFDRIVAAEAARHMSLQLVLPALRLHAQVRAICERLRSRIVVTLYEGHAWERCVWAGVDAAGPAALRVGYQHTVVWRLTHAIRTAPGGSRQYRPDVVLTSGPLTAEDLRTNGDLGGAEVLPFGSYRRPGPTVVADAPASGDGILVLPDGIISETAILFGFACEAARATPRTRFVLRTHPLIPFERVAATIGRPLPPNVEVSTGTLEEDLARSRGVLYRGSSAVLTAVLAGLKPYYLERPGEVAFDPLERLDGWRERVEDVPSFAERLAADGRSPEPERRAAWEHARSYCDRYLAPVRETAIDELLERATRR